MPLTPRQAGRLAEHILADQYFQETDAVPPGEAAASALPHRIGRCLIRRLIAAGGMGVVYEAVQENPRRTVAVKVMSRQIAARGAAALRRFEYEAQILARLDHPGLAKIHEAGSWDDGTGSVPYFVMEFIPEARNIIEFADAHDLKPRRRLDLFAKVCDAVHHGHQKGIIHRDLKPANIMVQEPADDDSDQATHTPPQPKVIDFGVARAADTDISVTTMHTRSGEIVGTLQYMSPEQCSGDPHAIDVRSDVYALGVILYELLCGRRPYDLANTPIPRAARIVQEQEPDRPRLISPALRGNLEAIMLKAIEKHPANRYQSAVDLARDVRRYLAGEPIEARHPGAWTRMIRFVGRHPVLVTAGLCITVVMLTLATTYLSVFYLNFRPHHMELTSDGREARLVSYGGRILQTWPSSERDGITFAELVSRDRAGPLAVIGFNHHHDNQLRGAICAFDLASDLEEPVWKRRITEDDLLAELRQRDVNIAGFGVSEALTENVFPQVPGVEIVTAYAHAPSSPGVIAVYDTSGTLLYRVWHDGTLGKGYWMEDAGLLITAGLNSEVPWSERGYPDVVDPHPTVIVALRPLLGHVGRTLTTPSPGGDTTTLAWYLCVLPPPAPKRVGDWAVGRPRSGYDRGRFVELTLNLDVERGISLILDASGNEVQDTRMPNSQWRADKQLSVGLFKLGALPPIKQTNSGN